MVMDALVTPFQVLVRQRPAITTFVQREIRTRYSASALGIGWALIKPFTLLALYTFVFSTLLKVPLGNRPGTGEFALSLFCGLVPWLAFTEAIARSTTVIQEHAQLVKRLRFPSEILPVHHVLVALAVESLGLVILLGWLVVIGRTPDWSLLVLAAVVVPQFLFTAGLAWMLASASVLLPDIRQAIGFVLMVWMYATPIVYPLSMVPDGLQWLFWLNPMTFVVESYRGAILLQQPPGLVPFALFCAAALVVFIAGYRMFDRLKYEFADVL
jgi:lipopolysaccharide transport system permease protein